MGRYYNGDINGKFGFGSQSSDDGEYFGAIELDPSVINYMIPHTEKEKNVKRLMELIKEFKENTGCKEKLTINTKVEDFWNMVDNDWYQKEENGLLASRIDMGLKIVEYFKANPDNDLYFEAEL